MPCHAARRQHKPGVEQLAYAERRSLNSHGTDISKVPRRRHGHMR